MSLGGVLGNGSKVGFAPSSPLSYTKIAQLMDIPQFISLVANIIDTTVHSTSRLMTSMPGMIPAPEIQLDLLADLDPVTCASQESLRSYQDAGTTIYFLIEIPVNRAQTSFRSWEFQAFVKEWTPKPPIGDKQALKVTLVYAGGLIVRSPAASVLG